MWQVRPHPDGEHRIVAETWLPPAPARTYLDVYGNICDRLTLPGDRRCVSTTRRSRWRHARRRTDRRATEIDRLPSEAFVYLLASRYCWPDLLHDAAWDLFGATQPGWARVQAVCDWIHENITYEVGASSAFTTASTCGRRAPACAATSPSSASRCAGRSTFPPVTSPATSPTSGSSSPISRWISVPGSRRGSMVGGGRSIPATTSRASAASSSPVVAMRSTVRWSPLGARRRCKL